MPTLRESILRKLIENGETSTIELKVAIPRPGEMAEKLCGLANAQGGLSASVLKIQASCHNTRPLITNTLSQSLLDTRKDLTNLATKA